MDWGDDPSFHSLFRGMKKVEKRICLQGFLLYHGNRRLEWNSLVGTAFKVNENAKLTETFPSASSSSLQILSVRD